MILCVSIVILGLVSVVNLRNRLSEVETTVYTISDQDKGSILYTKSFDDTGSSKLKLRIVPETNDSVASVRLTPLFEVYRIEELHGISQDAGSSRAGTWTPRPFHRVESNLPQDQSKAAYIKDSDPPTSFMLGPGSWSLECWSTVVASGSAVLRLYNVTQDKVVATGQVVYHGTKHATRLSLDTILTVGNEAPDLVETGDEPPYEIELRLEMYVTETRTRDGAGQALLKSDGSRLGEKYVLSSVKISRV